MRILVCGDRNWTNIDLIRKVLTLYEGIPGQDTLIHGNCSGADKLAGLIGSNMGFRVRKYSAQWNRYGKAAGPIRNQRMLDEGKPDIVIGFHDNIEQSKGTKDMLNRARKAGIPVELYDSKYRKVDFT